MRIVKLGILALVGTLWFGACSDSKPENVVNTNIQSVNQAGSPLPASTIDELASGRKVFEQNCAICHKANGTGGKVVIEGKQLDPDDLTSDKIKSFSDEKIVKYILNGVIDEGMPAFKDKLSEGEIRDVLKHMRTQFHGK